MNPRNKGKTDTGSAIRTGTEIDDGKLRARDNAWLGNGCGFVAPRLPRRAKSKAANYALAKMHSDFPQSVTLHVYTVARLLEEAFTAGKEDAQ